MIEQHGDSGDTIMIPTPALAETYIGLDDPEGLDDHISRLEIFQPYPFDKRAALELAKLTNASLSKKGKKKARSEPYQKVKIDRQIVAIAKVCGADILYTDDGTQTKFAEESGIKVVHSWDLEISAKYRQKDMF